MKRPVRMVSSDPAGVRPTERQLQARAFASAEGRQTIKHNDLRKGSRVHPVKQVGVTNREWAGMKCLTPVFACRPTQPELLPVLAQ